MDGSSSSRAAPSAFSLRLDSFSSKETTMKNTTLRTTLTLPRQLHHSSQSPSAPLLRFPSHSRTRSHAHSPSNSPSSTSPSFSSPPDSRPPSPVLNSLNEALTESILPSLPPPAWLPASFTESRTLSRPPLLTNIRHISPSAPLSAKRDFTLPPTLSLTATVAPSHSPPTHSSLDTLRSIHTSVPSQIPSTSSVRRWWFQSEPETPTREHIVGTGDELDLLDGNAVKEFRAPQAPLVFCHGLLGFDSVTIGPAIAPLQVYHWRGIKEVLEANGCEVLVTRVPATSSPVDRAKVLERKISETYPGRDVHLIGHSMGGIDCRYLITHLTQRSFRVLSLTTIATPHRGSSFASHFLSLASNHLPAVLSLLELLPNGGGDGKAFECLTREAMREFNESTPDMDDVRYFSWGAEYEPGLIDTWKYPHSIIAAQEGPNDGLVSVESARWGTYLGTLRNVNHLDLVGWTGGLAGNIRSIAGFKDMHALIRGNDVEFSAGRFYGGVADLLAGVEEEEGLVVDGKWVGSEGKEERKKKALKEAAGIEGAEMEGEEVLKRSASDKERWRMEEVLQSAPSLSPFRSGYSTTPYTYEGEHVELHTQRRVPISFGSQRGEDADVQPAGVRGKEVPNWNDRTEDDISDSTPHLETEDTEASSSPSPNARTQLRL